MLDVAWPVKFVNGLPFLVTVQLNVKPVDASLVLGSVALAVNVTGLFSSAALGPVMVTDGAVLVKVSVVDAAEVPSESVTRNVTLNTLGPSSIPRVCSCVHASVGVLPVASPKMPSPFTSQV